VKRTALILALGLLPALLAAQEGNLVVLQNADSLEGRVIDGEDVRELIGNVHMTQGKVDLWCDRAIQYVRLGRVDLMGNVLVREDSLTLRAPRAAYHQEERRAEGFDGVQLDDGATILRARYGNYWIDRRLAQFSGNVLVLDSVSAATGDSLTYYRDDRRSIMVGNVSVNHRPDRVVITGGRLLHDGARDYSRVTLDPVLTQIDSSGGGRDTLVVRALAMEAVRDSARRFLAIDSVRIVRRDLAAVAGLAVFFTDGDSIRLRKSPLIWYQETQVSGDSIDVMVRRRALESVLVSGSAKAISRSTADTVGRYDQITGEMLRMEFRDRQLSRLDVETQAISIYHLTEDSLANGLNRTTGDRILMSFEEGKIRTIRVFGGVEGQYVPENVLRGRESEYRIPGFVWRTDRPTKDDARPTSKRREGDQGKRKASS